jgi:hypothetical protein
MSAIVTDRPRTIDPALVACAMDWPRRSMGGVWQGTVRTLTVHYANTAPGFEEDWTEVLTGGRLWESANGGGDGWNLWIYCCGSTTHPFLGSIPEGDGRIYAGDLELTCVNTDTGVAFSWAPGVTDEVAWAVIDADLGGYWSDTVGTESIEITLG